MNDVMIAVADAVEQATGIRPDVVQQEFQITENSAIEDKYRHYELSGRCSITVSWIETDEVNDA